MLRDYSHHGAFHHGLPLKLLLTPQRHMSRIEEEEEEGCSGVTFLCCSFLPSSIHPSFQSLFPPLLNPNISPLPPAAWPCIPHQGWALSNRGWEGTAFSTFIRAQDWTWVAGWRKQSSPLVSKYAFLQLSSTVSLSQPLLSVPSHPAARWLTERISRKRAANSKTQRIKRGCDISFSSVKAHDGDEVEIKTGCDIH